MIPRKLSLRNFMCYREDVPPLEFDGLGIACLSGENGAGKSALLDALTWALWGEARLKSDDDLIALGATEMEVDLTFALDNQDYRVIRKRAKGKRSGQSWLDFQVRNNGAWKSLTGGTIRETQQTITSTLHMGYDTFANSAFLRQGRADEFTRKEPSKRKQVLAEILGLDNYEKLEANAKERAKYLDGQIKVADGQIIELENSAARREYYTEEVDQAESRAAAAQTALAQAETAFERANARVQELEQLRPQHDDLRSRIEQLRSERGELERLVERLGRAVVENQQIVDRSGEIRAGVAELAAARAEAERLEGMRASFDELAERQRNQQKAIGDAEQALITELRVAENELRNLRERAERLPTIDAKIAQFKQQAETFSGAQAELGKARSRRADLYDQLQQASDLQLKRKDLNHRIELRRDSLISTREELKRRLKDYTERLRPAARWESDLANATKQRKQIELEVAELEQLRTEEHASVEQVGALRAACETIKLQGEDINRKLALLGEDAHACPLCGSELGTDGVSHIEAEYERDRQDLRRQFSTRNGEAKRIEQELAETRTRIKSLESSAGELTRLAGQIARFEADLASAEDLRRRQSEDQRTLTELEVQLVKGDFEHGIRAELSQIEAQISGIGDPTSLRAQIDHLENQIARLEGQGEKLASIRSQIESAQRERAEIEAAQPAIYEHETHVRDLQTTLDMGDFAKDARVALARTEREIGKLGYTPEAYRAARELIRGLTHWDEQERRLQRAEERLADDTLMLDSNEKTLARRDQELNGVTAQLNALQEQFQALVPASRAREEAQTMVGNQRRVLAVAQRDLGEKQSMLRSAENAAVELFSQQQRRKELAHRKALFDELAASFGKKGVQALLIETAIPEIEREANTLLGNMTDNQMHLTFETQRDTRKGDVSETLDIKIADALGTRDYDAYSGGESFRVDFAIRIALAKLLARRAGARLETLVIDEGFGSQDAKGRERLVEAITSVQQDFKQILVVTHIQELKDLFPVQIEVTKKADGSVWAIA